MSDSIKVVQSVETPPSIAVIIPYYGQWPAYFNHFLRSCFANPWLHYHFITDLKRPKEAPHHCFWHYETFENLKRRVGSKLGINTSGLTPYKLCDFKPTYGFLFSEIIEKYNWWAFGDIDVVLGNTNKFLGGLNQVDVLSFREEWVSGSLMIIKNTKLNNFLYRQIDNWHDLLSETTHLGIDETSFCYDELRLKSINEVEFPYDNFTRVIRDFERRGKMKSIFETRIKEYLHPNESITASQRGVIDHENKEYAYYHLVNEKKNYFFQIDPISHDQFKFQYFDFGGGVPRTINLASTRRKSLKKKRWFHHIILRLKQKWEKL